MAELTHAEMRAVLDGVTYKPGWSLVLRDIPRQGIYFSVLVELENSYQPGTKVPLRIHSPVPPMADRQAFLTWLCWRLEVIETHEVLEWFKVDGNPWIDPHADLDAEVPGA